MELSVKVALEVEIVVVASDVLSMLVEVVEEAVSPSRAELDEMNVVSELLIV